MLPQFSSSSTHSQAPTIVGLLFRCSPADIAGFVIAVIVGVAVQGVFYGRAFPHIRQELLEAVDPLLADGNSTPPPFLIPRIIWIETPLLHSCPALIGGSVPHPVSPGSRRPFLQEASTRHCVPAKAVDYSLAALAFCHPVPGAFRSCSTVGEVDEREPADLLACSISWRWSHAHIVPQITATGGE